MRHGLKISLLAWFLGTIAAFSAARSVHPMSIYHGVMRIEDGRVAITLHADSHTLAHESPLFRNPPEPRYIFASIVSDLRVQSAIGEPRTADRVDIVSDGTNEFVVRVDFAQDAEAGVRSIVYAPSGPLADGRRKIALSIERPGHAPSRVLELTSGGNHGVFSITEKPIADPERFTRPRITVLEAGESIVRLAIDCPAVLVDDAIGRSRGRTDDILTRYESWAVGSFARRPVAPVERTDWIDEHGDTTTSHEDSNPRLLRARTTVSLPRTGDGDVWDGFTSGIRAVDVYDSSGKKTGTLTPGSGTIDILE